MAENRVDEEKNLSETWENHACASVRTIFGVELRKYIFEMGILRQEEEFGERCEKEG